MGPRRVGKTVLIRHAVRVLLDRGIRPEKILYVSVDHPLFNGLGLDDYLAVWEEADPGRLVKADIIDKVLLRDDGLHA